MNSSLHRTKRSSGGFTLVELLVSFTVLGLIMVGVAQMMSSALSATLGGYKHMDADTQARMVLDRMAFDISKMTKRMDVDYYFGKNTGNDQMAFYSESGGYYPSDLTSTTQQSDVSLVGYKMANNQLFRLSTGLTWNAVNMTDMAMIFNPNPINVTSNPLATAVAALPSPGQPNSNYQLIGDQVFRLEYCFLLQTSPTSSVTVPVTQSQTQSIAYFSDSPWVTPDTTPLGLKDVTAVVVTIAVLDTKSRAILGNSSTALTTAAGYLADDTFSTTTKAATTSSLPLVTWKAKLATNGLGLPQGAASQVRFYQRYCYLNHLQ
jgi:Tfp pilus assembly protein PilV